jgi:Uma2 family endonuclease
MLILDPKLCREIIRLRQKHGIDQHDEVWDGVYVVPPIAGNDHQDLVGDLTGILFIVIKQENRGRVLPGANVSELGPGWEHDFRGPDVVVVLNESRAIDRKAHWQGGPDFLIEVESPKDETEQKIPFYSRIGVRELLIIHRDTRRMQLLRHDGQELVPVGDSDSPGKKWLESKVVPLAFRRRPKRGKPGTEVRRTDGESGQWTV